MSNVFIIAEAGVNHNGSFEFAKKLVDKAAEAGADCVKFQTFDPNNLVTKNADKADYQKETTGKNESQLEMLKKLTLDKDEFVELKDYCKKRGIIFLSTPFDVDSVVFLEILGCDRWKIPSGEITNYPYLVKIAKTGKPVIMSTGMSNIEEIRQAMDVLKQNGSGEISLLHCNTQYPTPYEDVNLRAMLTLKEEFGVTVGYSDHTPGIEVPIAAVAMGAQVIEKHFTLDRNMEGPDHKASLEPDELKAMVTSIRNIEKALGSSEKRVSESERGNIAIARKSIVARTTIKKGDILTEENITTKRPGTGISPMLWERVIGTTAVRDFEQDELIEV
ncbi:MAG: N-acetylneuraminate synthase [Lachnospiraceae bacterium]|nr:N-acetylneuraminate synthase [Lachnospiraceae bacterium]